MNQAVRAPALKEHRPAVQWRFGINLRAATRAPQIADLDQPAQLWCGLLVVPQSTTHDSATSAAQARRHVSTGMVYLRMTT